MEENEYFNSEYIYTEYDIHISKWNGGIHYYAMVGIFDVIDDDGTRKWVDYNRAYNLAVEYVHRLNSISYEDKMKL